MGMRQKIIIGIGLYGVLIAGAYGDYFLSLPPEATIANTTAEQDLINKDSITQIQLKRSDGTTNTIWAKTPDFSRRFTQNNNGSISLVFGGIQGLDSSCTKNSGGTIEVLYVHGSTSTWKSFSCGSNEASIVLVGKY
jgi:hypothetical protein